MSVAIAPAAVVHGTQRHALWVRVSHWILTASVLALAFSGVEILMVHPRLYWGEVGNGLTPALIELPISRNHQHEGWQPATPFFDRPGSPVSANHTFRIFNQNSWGRSLHFLAAWCLVLPGIVYLARGAAGGHFLTNFLPGSRGHYGAMQRMAYSSVVFVAAPLIVLTGLAMSPAVTAAVPVLHVFGGYQSARTIHFFAFVALMLFTLVHVVKVIRSGFRRQMRAMTIGD